VNDLYRPLTQPKAKDIDSVLDAPKVENAKHDVAVSRWVTVLLMAVGLLVTTQLKTISGVWEFIIECGAGLGLVLILRWYWWRISAWSEITATIAPFVGYGVAHYALDWAFPNSFFFTIALTTVSWILITFLTAPTAQATIDSFVERVNPDGWWNRGEGVSGNLPMLFLCWVLAILMTYSTLFGIGKLILFGWSEAWTYLLAMVLSGVGLSYSMRRTNLLD
jgi:hypothetical protein